MATIYGVDTEKEITPEMVRDAIVECFYEMHCAGEPPKPEDEKTNKDYCRTTIQSAFSESGGDFDKPTKESVGKAVEQLKSFCKTFKIEDAEERAAKILELANKIK